MLSIDGISELMDFIIVPHLVLEPLRWILMSTNLWGDYQGEINEAIDQEPFEAQ